MANLKIVDCNGCYLCMSRGTWKRPCPSFDDDMTPLYAKIASADGYIFASPVYYGSVTGLMKCFMDRFLPFHDAPGSKSELRGALKFKPAGTIAVGEKRNDGIESVLATLFRFFLYNGMLVTGASGGLGAASDLGGAFVTGDKPDVLGRDELGVNTVRVLAENLSSMAEVLKVGRQRGGDIR